MEPFQIEITEPKPLSVYTLRGQIDLTAGTNAITDVTTLKDISFQRIHETHKSRLTFNGAARKEGLIYFYFIVLDNAHAYLYIIGTTNDRALIRGGAFMEVDAEDSEDVGEIISQYVQDNTKKLTGFYSKTDSPALINALNKAIGQIADLIP